jgi:hypothetical protein
MMGYRSVIFGFSVAACGPAAPTTRTGSTPPVVELTTREQVPERAVELALGDYLSCARMESGTVRCWGDRVHFRSRQEVPALKGLRGLAIARSDWSQRICGIRDAGEVLCLVLARGEPRLERVGISDATAIVAGPHYADGLCALRRDGSVGCWAQAYGYTDEMAPASDEELVGPHTVQGLPPLAKVHRASSFCGATPEGAFHCWSFVADQAGKKVHAKVSRRPVLDGSTAVDGDLFVDAEGALRRATDDGESEGTPWTMPPLRALRTDRFTCGITTSAEVVCGAGREDYLNHSNGVLGLGHRDPATHDTWGTVELPAPAEELEVGSLHACARLLNGEVHCWGNNELEQLGQPRRSASAEPVRIRLSGGVKQVDADYETTCAVTEDDGVHCWGHPTYPGVTLLSERASQIFVAGGNNPMICGHTTDRVWCHEDGEPFVDHAAADVEEVVAGWQHLCWRDTSSRVFCAGERRLEGGGSVTFGPELVAGLSARDLFVFAGWVAAHTEQGPRRLDLAEARPPAPAIEVSPAPELEGLTIVSSSTSGLCGTKNGGLTCLAPWITGENRVTHRFDGYLADAVDVGPFHSCALRDGNVACWGSGADGQGGYWGHRDQPTAIALPFRVDEIAAGRSHTCLRSGRELHCLGSNSHGQMATTPTDDVFPSPVLVDLPPSS